MRLDTYVNFAGRCAEAFRYYEKHLGGAIEMMTTHDQSPESSRLPAEWQQAVLHARLRIGDAVLMGADIPNAQPMRSAYLTLRVDRDAEAERIYAALSEGGRILMPIAETFYASRFAQVQDQFGMNWMIMCERPPRIS